MAAQHPRAEGVEGAEPQPLGGLAEDGGNADIGTGVLKVGEILRYIRDKKLNIGCIIEQNGRAGAKDNLEAVKMNLEWMKKELNA